MNDKKNTGCSIAIFIVIILIIGASLSQCSGNKSDGSFLNRDPRTWTQQEKNSYNNFADWLGKQ